MSDHGYNLGEHTHWQKMSFWEDTTKSSLHHLSPFHKSSQGKSCDSITELIDLYPTIGDLTDTKSNLPSILEGKSLKKYLENPELNKEEEVALTTMGKGMNSIRLGHYRYSQYPDGEEFYDLSKDPNEFNNLAQNPEHHQKMQTLKLRLQDLIK